MIVSYLQSLDIPKEIAKVNLGKIMVNFLGFYGSFDQENTGIFCHLPASRAHQQIEKKANQYPIITNVSAILL